MTTVLTRPAALLHTDGAELRRLFGAVLPHAVQPDSDSDWQNPILAQVHVEVRDGDLRLVCSDRYTLAVVRRSMDSTTEGFACTLAFPVDEIGRLLESLDEDMPATLAIHEKALSITTGDALDRITGEASRLPWRDALHRLMTPTATPTTELALNPALVARLQHAQPLGPGAKMHFSFRGEHAVIATLGATFLALIKPAVMSICVRFGEAADRPLDPWFDLLDEQ